MEVLYFVLGMFIVVNISSLLATVFLSNFVYKLAEMTKENNTHIRVIRSIMEELDEDLEEDKDKEKENQLQKTLVTMSQYVNSIGDENLSIMWRSLLQGMQKPIEKVPQEKNSLIYDDSFDDGMKQ